MWTPESGGGEKGLIHNYSYRYPNSAYIVGGGSQKEECQSPGQRASKMTEDTVLCLNTIMGEMMTVFNLSDNDRYIIVKDAHSLKQDVLELAKIQGMTIDFNPYEGEKFRKLEEKKRERDQMAREAAKLVVEKRINRKKEGN